MISDKKQRTHLHNSIAKMDNADAWSAIMNTFREDGIVEIPDGLSQFLHWERHIFARPRAFGASLLTRFYRQRSNYTEVILNTIYSENPYIVANSLVAYQSVCKQKRPSCISEDILSNSVNWADSRHIGSDTIDNLMDALWPMQQTSAE